MMNDSNNSENRREKMTRDLRVILFAGAMLAFIGGSFFLIFKGTSGASNPEDTYGLNVTMPEGKPEKIERDKMRALNKIRQTDEIVEFQLIPESLDEFADDPGDFPVENAQQSFRTYKTVSSQLQSFDTRPNESQTIREMQKEIERLKETTASQPPPQYDPAQMIEQSYSMVAKLFNNSTVEAPVTNEVTNLKEILPVRTITEANKTVTSLDGFKLEDFLDESRNYDFITAVGQSHNMNSNTANACIDHEQQLSSGSPVKIRLNEAIMVGEHIIPNNSILTGSAVLGNNYRLRITIDAIEFRGNILPVELTVHDQDGQEGLYIPVSSERNAVKDAAGAMTNSLGSGISLSRDAKQQVAMDATRSLISGSTQYLSTKIKEVRVTLKPGYKVLLVSRN